MSEIIETPEAVPSDPEANLPYLIGVRLPKRPLPEFKRGRLYRKLIRRATEAEAAEWHDRRDRELRHAETCRRRARGRGLRLKIVDVEIDPRHRRVTVLFS